MFADYFQTWPLPVNQYLGGYDYSLVGLSYLVAVFASYIALDFTGRLRDSNNTPSSSRLWLMGGAIAMGSGIWSMHFIGMLSFTIPGLQLQYDLFWTGLSLLVAIIASAFALLLLKQSTINVVHLIAGGIILGLAISSMHYTGMAAMLITLNIRYLPDLFFLSILIAIVASEAAIWLALKSTTIPVKQRTRMKLVSAAIMGLAICGMHYTGMAASIFTPLCTTVSTSNGSMSPLILSLAIAGVTFIILAIAFFASAVYQQQFEKARQLGMAEIATTVLHNVGNVLNSVNVSIESITEKISSSQMKDLEKLCTLLNEHKQNLSAFFDKDPRGGKVLEFINNLAEYQQEEQRYLSNEMKNLEKNVRLITEIITRQQELHKSIRFKQSVTINEALDEALLITGFNFRKDIVIEKEYKATNTIEVDNVKLMQILVNLFRNAKEALIESSNINKRLVIKTSVTDENQIKIQLSDNGIGISPENINKIFNYGFTTKKSGHGFGLHPSAIAIKEMGGEIHVESEGHEKGTCFTLLLPINPTK